MVDGSKVRELREKAGLTREELSKDTKISAQHLYRIESGASNLTSMTYHNLKKLADALNVSVSELTDSDEEKIDTFIARLSKLSVKDRAYLRREAGVPMGQARTSHAYRVFYGNLPAGLAPDEATEEVCYQVACIAANGMFNSDGNTKYTTLPSALHQMKADGNQLVLHRAENALDSYWGEDGSTAQLVNKLVKLAVQDGFNIDYVSLLRDALRWNDENHPVQREWVPVLQG